MLFWSTINNFETFLNVYLYFFLSFIACFQLMNINLFILLLFQHGKNCVLLDITHWGEYLYGTSRSYIYNFDRVILVICSTYSHFMKIALFFKFKSRKF